MPNITGYIPWNPPVPGAAGVPYGDMASGVNSFMSGQALAPYLANLPNYANMVGQRSENITQQLSGELPQDVLNQIMQQGAERGISTGAAGSQNANSAMLRALGLNSLQMQQQGSAGLSQAIADTPVPELWNPMSLYVPQTLAREEAQYAQEGMKLGFEQQQKAAYAAEQPQKKRYSRKIISRGGAGIPGFTEYDYWA